MKLFILMTGNPIDGFELIGPFNTDQDATNYANTHLEIYSEEYWIFPLAPPLPDRSGK